MGFDVVRSLRESCRLPTQAAEFERQAATRPNAEIKYNSPLPLLEARRLPFHIAGGIKKEARPGQDREI